MKEPWNLDDGLGNVCAIVLSKMHHASRQLEVKDKDRTIVNLDTYEITAIAWAVEHYIKERIRNDKRRTDEKT